MHGDNYPLSPYIPYNLKYIAKLYLMSSLITYN